MKNAIENLDGFELNGKRIKLIDDKTRQKLLSGGPRSRSCGSMSKTFGTFSATYAWECPGCRLQNIPERSFCYHCKTKKPVKPNDEKTLNKGMIFILYTP